MSSVTPFTLKNTGTASLVVSSLAITGADASEFAFTAPTLPITLAPNATAVVNVTFAPVTTGAKSATLAITDNAAGSPHSASLSGTGTAATISVNPPSLTFGDQVQGVTSAAKSVTVQNTGTADLVISTITLGGAGASDFAMTAP